MPNTSLPAWGAVHVVLVLYVEPGLPPPGTLKIGSRWQSRTSNHIGVTA